MKMNKEEFYAAVAVILEVENTYMPSMPYRRRWGQRSPGNGRYEGIGVVRWYGDNMIHCMLVNGNKVCHSPEAALAYIKDQLP